MSPLALYLRAVPLWLTGWNMGAHNWLGLVSVLTLWVMAETVLWLAPPTN